MAKVVTMVKEKTQQCLLLVFFFTAHMTQRNKKTLWWVCTNEKDDIATAYKYGGMKGRPWCLELGKSISVHFFFKFTFF